MKAVRFVAEDTIDEKIIELQKKKQLIFEGALESDVAASNTALKKLGEEDLRFLFQG